MFDRIAKALIFPSVLALAALVGCGDPVTVCPAILHFRPSIPDSTTIKVGASTIAIAGATWGCRTEPLPIKNVWAASDSSVVSVTVIDSIHARIQGLRPGTATVAPTLDGSISPLVSITVRVVP